MGGKRWGRNGIPEAKGGKRKKYKVKAENKGVARGSGVIE